MAGALAASVWPKCPGIQRLPDVVTGVQKVVELAPGLDPLSVRTPSPPIMWIVWARSAIDFSE